MKDGEIVQTGTPEEILTQPADEYVEKFIEDVDRTKVLTASNVMIRPTFVNIDKDGPRIAMRRMRENEISSVYVVDSKRKFVGVVDAAHVMDLIKEKNRDLLLLFNAMCQQLRPTHRLPKSWKQSRRHQFHMRWLTARTICWESSFEAPCLAQFQETR